MKLPEGYVELPLRSAFTQVLGPVYMRQEGTRRSFAVRVERHHLNASGYAHGGFLMTVADVALTWGHADGTHIPRITVSLNCDFVGTAREGDWLEVDVDLQRQGRTLVFVNGNLRVGTRPIAHASGVLRTVPAP